MPLRFSMRLRIFSNEVEILNAVENFFNAIEILNAVENIFQCR